MKKTSTLLLTAVLVFLLSACSFVSANDDEWKNNVGTVNLDSLTVTGDGIEVQNNTVIITEGGDFTVTGSLEDGMIKINSEDKVKLRLSGMSLTNSSGPSIYFENAEKGFITITENTENYIKDGENYSIEDADAAIFSNDDLEIKGAGTLTVEGNYKHGIASDDDLSIENGTIIITSNEHGIKANNKVTVTGGNIDITAKTGKGIKAGEELLIDAGVINIVSMESEGLESKGTITINGGNINITAADDGINTGNANSQNESDILQGVQKDKSFENGQPPQNQEMPMNMQGKQRMTQNTPNGDFENGESPQMPNFDGETPPEMKNGRKMGGNRENGMPPQNNKMSESPQNNDFQNGKMVEPPQNADMPNMEERQGGMTFGGLGEIDEETAKAHAVTINGGNIYIKTSGDGIDSNGNLTITGGTIKIDGPEMSGNGPLDSEGTISITGGEIITLSSAGMLQLPNSSDTQNTLKVIFSKQGVAGDTVTIKDGSGNDVMSTVSEGKYMALIYSSDKLKEGNTYSVYINNDLVESVTITKGITSTGNSTGLMSGFNAKNNDVYF